MKTSCSDIWTERQSCSEREEEEDDEGKPWPFLKLEGRGGGSAPCHRQRDAFNSERVG